MVCCHSQYDVGVVEILNCDDCCALEFELVWSSEFIFDEGGRIGLWMEVIVRVDATAPRKSIYNVLVFRVRIPRSHNASARVASTDK